MTRRGLALLLWLGVVGAAGPAVAGPWTPAPGAGYAKVQIRWLPGIGWNPGPDAERPGVALYGMYHEVFVGGFYGELGLAPRVAVIVHTDGLRLFFLQDPRDKRVGAHASLGEPTVALKLQPVQAGRFALAVQAFVSPPVRGNEPVQDVVSTAEGNPVLGGLRVASGVVQGGGALELGVGLGRLYLAGSVGPRFRGGGWDTVLGWSLEGGLTVGAQRKTSVRLRLAGFHPLQDGSAPYHASPSGLGNGTAYIGFTLEVERRVTELLSAGFSLAGGLGPVVRQTGGPVLTAHLAVAWP